MPDPDLIFEPLASEALHRFVSDNVISVTTARTGVSDWHPVGYFLRTRRGEWVGGLTGTIWGGWLHVQFLWVAECLRGQRQGTRLMDAAEYLAVERDASNASLETLTCQAPGFYMKCGYEVFGRLDDHPPGHAKLFLRKQLLAPSQA